MTSSTPCPSCSRAPTASTRRSSRGRRRSTSTSRASRTCARAATRRSCGWPSSTARWSGSVDYYAPGESPYHAFVGFPADWAAFRFLGTDPERRGAGIGRALVEHLIALARADGAGHLGLHTGPFMVAAKAMYERMGFERSPEHDFFPVPDEDLRVLGYR